MPHAEVADGLRLFYRFDGPEDAPVLVLSNSLGTTHRMWEPQIPELSKRFRVLRYDRRGHGASDVPPGPYTMATLGGDAVGLLDRLGIARATWCGLSIGGMVGMWLGSHAAEQFDRLILANTAAQMAPVDAWETRIRAVREHGMEPMLEPTMERWFTPEFREMGDPMIDVIRRDFVAIPPVGYAGCCAAIRDMDQRETISAIRLPTLVIVGERDPAAPPASGELIVRQIAGARLVSLPAAHLSNIERPAEFTRAVIEFAAA